MKNISNYEFESMLERLSSEASVSVARVDALTTLNDKNKIKNQLERRLCENDAHCVIFLIEL